MLLLSYLLSVDRIVDWNLELDNRQENYHIEDDEHIYSQFDYKDLLSIHMGLAQNKLLRIDRCKCQC